MGSKFSSLVCQSRNWECCRSNRLCPLEISTLLSCGFLSSFLANHREGLRCHLATRQSFWTKKDGESKHFLLCHVLLHLAMHFSTDLAFSSRRVGLSLCGPCYICKSKDNIPIYLEVVRPELLLQGIWEWEEVCHMPTRGICACSEHIQRHLKAFQSLPVS